MLYDKTGRPIHEFDIVKVYHFTGARKKKYYMYKRVLGYETHGKDQTSYMRFDHLERKEGGYLEKDDGRVLSEYEIVQGFGRDGVHFEDRKRIKP